MRRKKERKEEAKHMQEKRHSWLFCSFVSPMSESGEQIMDRGIAWGGGGWKGWRDGGSRGRVSSQLKAHKAGA